MQIINYEDENKKLNRWIEDGNRKILELVNKSAQSWVDNKDSIKLLKNARAIAKRRNEVLETKGYEIMFEEF